MDALLILFFPLFFLWAILKTMANVDLNEPIDWMISMTLMGRLENYPEIFLSGRERRR
jgi:hypothetical protein